jgi:hypothetical protein
MRTHWRVSVAFPFVVLMLASALSARQTENKSFTDPRIQVSVQDAADGTYVSIQNLSSQPITAYIAEMRQVLEPGQTRPAVTVPKKPVVTSIRSRKKYDCVAMPWHYKPIVQNATDKFLAWRPSTLKGTVTLLAVIFADGTTAGEPEWIARLLAIRGMYRTHLTEIVALLRAEQEKNGSLNQLLADLQTARQARGPYNKATMDRDDWDTADGFYRTAIGNVNDSLHSPTPDTAQGFIAFQIGVYTDLLRQLNSSLPPLGATP